MYTQKIGIFGGTFDPFTPAHLNIVEQVLEKNLVDILLIVPTIVTYHRNTKDSWLSHRQRLDVIHAVISDSIYDRVFVDAREYDFFANHSWHTCSDRRYIHTLMDIKADYPDSIYVQKQFYTIIGTDSVWNLKSWYKYEDVIANSKLIGISGRDGISLPDDIPVDAVLQIDPRYAGISASALRERYQQLGIKAYIDDLKNGKTEAVSAV